MDKEIINSPHYVTENGKYAIIAYNTIAFFYDVTKNIFRVLKDYTPSKNDIVSISNDGKRIFILKKNILKRQRYYHEPIPTEAKLYSADSGEITTKIIVPVYDNDIFGDTTDIIRSFVPEKLKKISCFFSNNTTHISMQATNTTYFNLHKVIKCFNENDTGYTKIRGGVGENYYVAASSNHVCPVFQIHSYNKLLPPIPIIHRKHAQARSITFTPGDEYIILTYTHKTDIIALDQKNHTIKEKILLPFAGNFTIKKGKAIIVNEDDKDLKNPPYFLYQEGYFTDTTTTKISEQNNEIFLTDIRKDPDEREIKTHSFTITKDKNNNPFLDVKKIATQQETLLLYTHNKIYTDVDFEFVA